LAFNLDIQAVAFVDHVGDVVGVHFTDEEEIAIFIPCSGDVLLCTAFQWQTLNNSFHKNLTDSLTSIEKSSDLEKTHLSVDLKSTLIHLGVGLV